MRHIKTAALIGILSVTALPALAGPAGHFSGGAAMQAAEASGRGNGEAMAKANSASKAVNAAGQKIKVEASSPQSTRLSSQQAIASTAKANAPAIRAAATSKAELASAKLKGAQSQAGIAFESLSTAASSTYSGAQLVR